MKNQAAKEVPRGRREILGVNLKRGDVVPLDKDQEARIITKPGDNYEEERQTIEDHDFRMLGIARKRLKKGKGSKKPFILWRILGFLAMIPIRLLVVAAELAGYGNHTTEVKKEKEVAVKNKPEKSENKKGGGFLKRLGVAGVIFLVGTTITVVVAFIGWLYFSWWPWVLCPLGGCSTILLVLGALGIKHGGALKSFLPKPD